MCELRRFPGLIEVYLRQSDLSNSGYEERTMRLDMVHGTADFSSCPRGHMCSDICARSVGFVKQFEQSLSAVEEGERGGRFLYIEG